MSRPTVLIAHDDLIALDSIERALAPLGVEIARAGSGKQALAMAQRLRPALVVAALPLRGISGTRLVAAMAATETRLLFVSPAVLAVEIGPRVSFAPAKIADPALRAAVMQLLPYRNLSSNWRASRALTP